MSAAKGGGKDCKMLTIADKGGVLTTNDITDKMTKNTIHISFPKTDLYILLTLVKYYVFFLPNMIIFMNTMSLNLLTKLTSQKEGGLGNGDRADKGVRGLGKY